MEQRIERIRQRAHEIWEREGKPDGREHEHWQMALAETEAEEAVESTSIPAAPAAKTRRSEDAVFLQEDQAAAPEKARSRVARSRKIKKDLPPPGAGEPGGKGK